MAKSRNKLEEEQNLRGDNPIPENGESSSDCCKSVVTRQSREKFLLFCLLLCVLAIVGLIIAVVFVAKTDDVNTHPDICLTSDCVKADICLTYDYVKAAATLMDSINTSVNPCEDFYTYTCGRWKQKNIIPDDKTEQTVFALLNDKVEMIIKNLLENKDANVEVAAIQKAKDMYASCIDIALIDKKGISVAIPLLEELGGWPVLGSNPGGRWDENHFNLARLLTILKKYNTSPLINMYVSLDEKDPENRIIYLDQPSLSLKGRVYYLDSSLEPEREAYVKVATSVAVLFGADETKAEDDIREFFKLETDLANISMAAEYRRDNEDLYNKMNISELKGTFTEPGPTDPIQFDWLEYLSGIMNLDNVNVPINQSEYVVVKDVPYFQRLFTVLQKYDKRVIANYAVWYIMERRTRNLDKRFLDLLNEFQKTAIGTKAPRPRWVSCVKYVVQEMGMVVGNMFIQETSFDESTKSVALDMIGNIREAFIELLEDVYWMDDDTKQLSSEKMKAIRSFIGYPSYITKSDILDKLYQNVTVYMQDYFLTVLNNLQRRSSRQLQDLRKKYEHNGWTIPPTTVNAFYYPALNNIVVPAGILQPPFYSKNRPTSMNYGAIGMIFGHEITHGFDNRGRQYDKDGNRVKWWKPEIIDNFKEKAQCIVDQYSNFSLPAVNLKVNGTITLDENIADNGGLKQSFRAYRKWVEKRGSEEPTLPGLNFTSNQLFFISFAQMWCSNMRKEATIYLINNDSHSPKVFRVTGTLQNSKEFAQAFGCSNDQYMNPKHKCNVW